MTNWNIVGDAGGGVIILYGCKAFDLLQIDFMVNDVALHQTRRNPVDWVSQEGSVMRRSCLAKL